MITKKVVLVSLNDSNVPAESSLQTELNKVFAQGVVNVAVSKVNFSATGVYDASKGIGTQGDHYAYSDDMKAIVSAFKKTANYTDNKGAVFLFFGNRAASSNVEGVMNRGYEFGFIFNPSPNVIAH